MEMDWKKIVSIKWKVLQFKMCKSFQELEQLPSGWKYKFLIPI